MDKTIKIDGRDVPFKANGAIPLIYATAFNSDLLIDALGVKENKSANTLLMYRQVWAMAKAADKSIPALEAWIEGFENFPIYKIHPELADMFWGSCRGVTEKN